MGIHKDEKITIWKNMFHVNEMNGDSSHPYIFNKLYVENNPIPKHWFLSSSIFE